MMKNMKLFLLTGACILCLTGCNYQIEEDITGVKPSSETPASAEDDKAAGRDKAAGMKEDMSKFQMAFVPDRVSIAEYKTRYQDECNEVKNSSYETLSFQDCEMAPLGDVEKVGVYKSYADGLNADEGIEMVKNWLKDIGREDIDLKKELRDVSGQYEQDEGKNYPYNYVGVYDVYPEFEPGVSFLVNTNQCYIQMVGDGVHSMSDGSITAYLGADGKASGDAYGSNEKDIVDEGSVLEKSGDVWELVDGKLSVGDGAKVVKDYFEAGKAGQYPSGVSLDVQDVSVFSLKDKYGYAFGARRMYHGVPFSYFSYNIGRHIEDFNCRTEEDGKLAYIIGGNTVAAFIGYDVHRLKPLIEEQTEIMGLKDAVSVLDDFWAAEVDLAVSKAELVYCRVRDESEEETETVYPCWQFDGLNDANGQKIRAYVNVLSGEVYYYVYTEDTGMDDADTEG